MPSTKKSIGIIGVGSFACRLIEGFMHHDPSLPIVLSPRNFQRARRMSRRFGLDIAANNGELVARSDVVILASRPVHVLDSIAGLPWRRGQVVISVAAGVTRGELAAHLAPAEAVLGMPTNSGMIGSAAIPMHPHNATAEITLAMLGRIVVIEDEKVYEAAATLGAYYGWLLALMAQTGVWLEHKGLDPGQTRQLLSQVFRSAADISDHRAHDTLDQMVDELRTPGGLTEGGLELFAATKAIEEWSKVLDRIHGRLSDRY